MKSLVVALIIVTITYSCNQSTMLDIFRDENIPLEIHGKVTEIKKFRGGNVTLKIEEITGGTDYIAVGNLVAEYIRKKDTFEKLPNSNKCLIKRNDSIIFLECFEIPKDIEDQLGEIKEWEKIKTRKWFKQE